MHCGVYQIRNTATGQRYIGRAVNMRRRIGKHFTELRHGRHSNLHLQRSFVKYGEGCFVAAPMIVCRPEDVQFYEHLLIGGFRSDNPSVGFNRTVAIDNGILTHTPEARERIAEYNRTLKPKYERTPEIRARTAKSLTGRPGVNRGKKLSPEHCAKIGASKIGNKNRVGKTRSPEDRANIAASVRAFNLANPQAAQEQQAKATATRRTTDKRVAASVKQKALWADPEYRTKMKCARIGVGFRIWESRRRNQGAKDGND